MGMVLSLHEIAASAIDQLLDNPDELDGILEAEFENPVEDGPEGYLDKAWEAIHYLLTCRKPSADYLIASGDPVGDGSDGRSAYVLSPHDVGQFDTELCEIPVAELRSRYDPRAMTELEIYPNIWDRGDDADLEYVMEHFKDLKEFVQLAREKGSGVIICIS